MVVHGFHHHGEDKMTSLVYALRCDLDIPIALLNNLLDNCEAQAYTFAVELGGTVQLSKTLEKLREFFGSDTFARVNNINPKQIFALLVAHQNLNLALATSEFERVSDQVDHALLEPPFVAN